MVFMIKLMKHQKDVFEKTKEFNKCAFYMDMGLGKTFIGSEKMKSLNAECNLIICQKSKLQDWYDHIKEYYPEYRPLIYKKQKDVNKYNVIIINYDLIHRRDDFIDNRRPLTLLLDESQNIKNKSAKRTMSIMKLKADNIILLSGTPVGGKYEELLTQCKLLGWTITKESFWEKYVKFKNVDFGGGFPIPIVTGYKNIDGLKKKLSSYGVVFMKTEEAIELPDRTFININCENTKEYKEFDKHNIVNIKDKTLIGETLLTKLLYLRQLSSIYNNYKYDKLKDILESTTDRLVLFYNWKLEKEKLRKLISRPLSFIDGSVKNLDNYNNKSNSVTLVQYQSGSSGINLQKCNKVIYFSLPLSVMDYMQSAKRIHRIGQTSKCFYYHLITRNSIEINILNRLKKGEDYTNYLFKKESSGFLDTRDTFQE